MVATGAVSSTVLPDGTKLLLYPNGNRKEIWPDGKGTQVIYYNGDIKQKLANGFVVYTYADSGTKHTTKPDGTEILEFSKLVLWPIGLCGISTCNEPYLYIVIAARLRQLILMVDLKYNTWVAPRR